MRLSRLARLAGVSAGAGGFAAGVVLLLSSTAQAAPLPGSTTTNAPSALGAAAPYSEFSAGNSFRGQASATDSEGAVAVGGSLTGDLYFAGNYSSLSTAPYALVVGQNLSGTIDIQGPKEGIYGGVNSATQADGTPIPNLVKAS